MPILGLGEWHALLRSYGDQQAPMPPLLVAWSLGEPVEPVEIYTALDIGARWDGAPTDQTHKLIDLALDRLEEAFPDEVGGSGKG